uniref:Microtubule-associated protein Jupiter n=1 Tax=Eucampia antarctica TaxID=49252 RepID=A0A7S2QZQ3_9STRA|mmetsp:Transcript_10934/g.10448  ORF Transcript_10934/g.10448 Transcript_10934/m.10448 type:complete len:113 (+) Transcript_10934:23-361(+)
MSHPGYGCNDNQNYFVEGGKPSSRVLQQPGGKSSISLGWEEPKKIAPSRIDKEEKSKVEEEDESKVEDNKKEKVSSNAYASGSNMNSGNVITERPSSRVINPPGGKSSFSLY